MEAILDFTKQCNDQNNFGPYHYVGHTRKPYGRYQNHESAYIYTKYGVRSSWLALSLKLSNVAPGS